MAFVTGATALYSLFESKAEQSRQKSATRQNVASIKAENAEEARRLKLSQDRTVSLAKARAGASGVGKGGTVERYIDELKKNFELERNWIKQSSRRQTSAERTRGKFAQDTTRAQAWGTFFQQAGKAYGEL